MSNLWSWLLGAVGTTGLFFLGKKNIWAWLVLIFNECLWLVYATVTRQFGFYLASAAYIAVYVKNFRTWKEQA